MSLSTPMRKVNTAALLSIVLVAGAAIRVASMHDDAGHPGAVPEQTPASAAEPPPPPEWKPQPDRSGRTRVGVASFYAESFAGRVMANGGVMDPDGDNAASRTLPLGTTAKVTNLTTGQSAVVTIEDRGPYAKRRLVDLSPATAQKIGITRDKGVARVKVSPIEVPMPDGTVKPGAAADDPEVAQLR